MLTPTNDSDKPPLVAQVDEWIYTVVGKHAELYRQLLEAENEADRQLAFVGMSRLLHEAIEIVRVLGTNLREESKALRQHTTELLEHSQQLQKRYEPHNDAFRSDAVR